MKENISKIIAKEFSRSLLKDLGIKTMREIIKRNKIYSPDICATHDFCDSNVYMHVRKIKST